MQKIKYLPIQMPRGRKYGSDYFIVPSHKLGRNITLYSNLEFKNWLTIEMNPHIIAFCEQPYKAEMLYNGILKNTVFDMWVKYDDNREEFQEIKYSKELVGNDKHAIRSQEQIEFQRKWCKINKMMYVIRTEKEIEIGPYYIENLLHLTSRIKHYSHIKAKELYPHIKAALLEGPISILQLSSNLKCISVEDMLSIIAYAVYDGIVTLPLQDNCIGTDMEVVLNVE
jgi:hypothetical protein